MDGDDSVQQVLGPTSSVWGSIKERLHSLKQAVMPKKGSRDRSGFSRLDRDEDSAEHRDNEVSRPTGDRRLCLD